MNHTAMTRELARVYGHLILLPCSTLKSITCPACVRQAEDGSLAGSTRFTRCPYCANSRRFYYA